MHPDLHPFPTRRSSDLAGGDSYVFDSNISRRKALAYWLGPKTRCYVALSDHGIVGSYILKANQPGLGSHVANAGFMRSEEHTSELQSRFDLVCRLLLEK